MTASSLEDIGAPGATAPFLLGPILIYMEGGRYVGTFLPVLVDELVIGRRGDSGGSSEGGNRGVGKGCGRSSGGSGGSSGGRGSGDGGRGRGTGRGGRCGRGGGIVITTRVWVRYDRHLPALSIWDEENLRTILTGKFLPIFQGPGLCKNWHMC